MARRKGKTLSQQLGDPFGPVGNLTPAQRIKRGRDGRVKEDDPRWDPKRMGNRKGRKR